MMSQDEMLKLSISEYVYVSTVQPIKYTRLSSLFPSFFPYSTLEEACKKLGYYSFNDFIRQNHQLFDSFLTLFVCKDSGTKDSTESPFILYYYNTAAKSNPKFISNFVENQPLDPLHVQITMEESIFFESHNSLDIVDKRKEFVKLVEYCENHGLSNIKGMIPLCKINQAFRVLYENEEFSNKIKTWFPNRGGIENIVQKVLFEDLNFTLSDQNSRKESEFGLKKGWDEKRFDQLKISLLKIKNKIQRGLFLTRNDEEENFEEEAVDLCPLKSEDSIEGSTSDENVPSFAEHCSEVIKRPVISRTFTVKPDAKKTDIIQKQGEESSPPFVVRTYNLSNDVDLNELYLEGMRNEQKRKGGNETQIADISLLSAENDDSGESTVVEGTSSNDVYDVPKVPAERGYFSNNDDELSSIEELVPASYRPSSHVQYSSAYSLEEESDQNATIEEEPAKRVSCDNIEFYYPSTVDFKNCCKMLGLDYHHNAYAFWNKFKIDKVSSNSVPDKLYSFPNNGFASISLFLTGSEGYAFEIKEALNKYFFTNMKTLGNELGYEISSWDHQKVAATIFSKAMLDIHFLTLIYLINCRIGIFDGKMWEYYGTWNHWDTRVLTFLLVLNNGMYCPVLSLKD